MILEVLTTGQLLAPIIAGAAVVVLYHYLGREYLGADENEYWNALRRTLLAAGNSTVQQKTGFTLMNAAKDAELVGTVGISSDELARALEKHGYAQCVLSGLKYRPQAADPSSERVDLEAGSMSFRESQSDLVPDVLAVRQVHVFWFENNDGSLSIYAHEEYSSLNPLVAWLHYIGKTQNAKKGIDAAEEVLHAEEIPFK